MAASIQAPGGLYHLERKESSLGLVFSIILVLCICAVVEYQVRKWFKK